MQNGIDIDGVRVVRGRRLTPAQQDAWTAAAAATRAAIFARRGEIDSVGNEIVGRAGDRAAAKLDGDGGEPLIDCGGPGAEPPGPYPT